MLEEPYTLFAAFPLARPLLTMATHGTDQDMVQRMLTAPNHRSRNSRSSSAASWICRSPEHFLTVGILLSVFYTVVPSQICQPQITKFRLLYRAIEMPVVFRGLIIAGVFATMMARPRQR